ncbi:Uncharacterised protein [uncultured archaeon]|nr:Uncharacterised protein [uncultured archaeon]
MVECKVQKNRIVCNCSYSCSRKGHCCECLSYHKSRDELPACFFSDMVERTYDRSTENFILTHQGEKR